MYYSDDKRGIEVANINRKIRIKQVYRHFKGGFYIVEDVAKNSETGEEMAVYRNLKTKELFVRPKEIFMSIKQTNDGWTFRFMEYHF